MSGMSLKTRQSCWLWRHHHLKSRDDSRFKLGQIAFDVLGFQDAVTHILALSRTRSGAFVVTPNVDHVVRAEHDPAFSKIVDEADLVLADGMPVLWASHFLGRPLPERIAGSDMTLRLCAEAARLGHSIYLLGGRPGEADLAAHRLQQAYPSLSIVGRYCPPFGFENDMSLCAQIAGRIKQVSPDIVFVGVGSPKQEKWIYAWRLFLDAGVLLGVGATIGFMAGTVKRAPYWMQRLGLEWLHRLVQEPRRLYRRYFRDLAFFPIVLRQWRRNRLGHTRRNPIRVERQQGVDNG
jgi:N-acetylglucosaminyldiphosphoundecaprenol N-acetyl-beta-D-mannosaminyltransferase